MLISCFLVAKRRILYLANETLRFAQSDTTEHDIAKLLKPITDRYGYSTVMGICGYTSADYGLQIHICNHQAE